MATYLIPQEALRNLNSADVAVLVCASLLHDLAMHLTEFGFQALINGQSHSPLPWFNLDLHGRVGDLSWIEEWDNYRSEVKRFCDHDFFLVLGDLPPPSQVIHWLETELPDNPIEWTGADKLLIGEFVRRKHGRLAHEIAMFGFPGLSAADFPILDEILPKLADIIGTVARSHSLPIREAAQYFEETYPKDRRPRGVAALYHMALLRVADYLQIEFDRAPPILLSLRSPKVPLSVEAWDQHQAIEHVSYTVEDKVGIKVELKSAISLVTYLQVREIIDGLQREMDLSSAVLSEKYGRLSEEGMDRLRLGKLRVNSNYKDTSLLNKLPFVAEPISFEADPHLMGLMVEPLYGRFPEFGIRELLQNAIDAVLERRHYESKHPGTLSPGEGWEVLVEIASEDGKNFVLTITDKGIGMTAETVRDFFLKAGASFRDSRRWQEEFRDGMGRSQVQRSGRFGVGVFAGFLLGDELEVQTRHVSQLNGLSFTARRSSDLIQIRKKQNAEHGTTIRITLSERIIEDGFIQFGWKECARWYGLADPEVRFISRVGSEVTELRQITRITNEELDGALPEWGSFRAGLFAQVTWCSTRIEVESVASRADNDNVDGDEIFDDIEYYEMGRRPRNLQPEDWSPRIYCNGLLLGAPSAVERSSEQSDARSRALAPARYNWRSEFPFRRRICS